MLKIKLYGVLFIFALLSACGNEENKKADTASNDSLKVSRVDAKKSILVFGNSLTAGLGVEPDEAFPALIGNKMINFNCIDCTTRIKLIP